MAFIWRDVTITIEFKTLPFVVYKQYLNVMSFRLLSNCKTLIKNVISLLPIPVYVTVDTHTKLLKNASKTQFFIFATSVKLICMVTKLKHSFFVIKLKPTINCCTHHYKYS